MIIELVTKQKKAKLQWVSMITQVSVESLTMNVEEMGLKIEDDFILLPSESKDQKALNLVKDKREQLLTSIIDGRYYRYNPAHSAHVVFDNVRKVIPMGRQTIRETEWLIDRFAKIKYIIISPNGEVIDTDEREAKLILERMKNDFRNYSDTILRTYIPIKKYLEFLIIPLLHDEEKGLSAQLLEHASKEDLRISNLAGSTIEQNILNKKVDKKGVVKNFTFRHLDGTTKLYKSHQIYKLNYQYMQIYEMEFRKQFYNQQNFITDTIRNILKK